MLNGSFKANRWQPISPAMWWAPSSCCARVMAEKIGRSGQPVQKLGGRGGTVVARALTSAEASTLAGEGAGVCSRLES